MLTCPGIETFPFEVSESDCPMLKSIESDFECLSLLFSILKNTWGLGAKTATGTGELWARTRSHHELRSFRTDKETVMSLALQMYTNLSSDPQMMCRPSGEKAARICEWSFWTPLNLQVSALSRMSYIRMRESFEVTRSLSPWDVKPVTLCPRAFFPRVDRTSTAVWYLSCWNDYC